MKLITAIIKPFKLEEVRESLDKIGITGIIMTKLDGSAKGGSLIGIAKKY